MVNNMDYVAISKIAMKRSEEITKRFGDTAAANHAKSIYEAISDVFTEAAINQSNDGSSK